MKLPAALPPPLRWATSTGGHRRAGWLALCASLVGLVAVVDVATGYEMSLSILYLAPVLLATWTLGFPAGIAFIAVSLVAWIVSVEFMGHAYRHPFYEFWDAAIRLATWTGFAVILERLKVALAHADERFVTVLAELDAAVYVIAPRSGELLYVNRRCEVAFGPGLRDAGDIERRLGGRGAPTPGAGSVQVEAHDEAAGTWYLLTARSIRWIDGRAVSLCIATDVTDRKRAEELARQQQERLEVTSRLTTLGEMASTLAHEINQPLAAIANYCMGCVRRLRSGEGRREDLLDALEKANAQAERAGGILARVRDFLRKREPVLVPCDLNAVIVSVARLIDPDSERHGARLRLALDAGLPPVLADRIMMEQVMLNILKNALEAMRSTPAPEREVLVSTRRGEADCIAVEVADRGCGLPRELSENLFIPYFTTRADGMGMGLHICRSIVERHGGHLAAGPHAGGGTIFRFTLPPAP